ncbi:hypothetical protein [Methanocella paludicola]|nr:hypothetical protein [Methanocella paludicola]
MKMDWKIIVVTMALVVVLSAIIFVPVSIAVDGGKAGGGNNTSVKANNTSAANKTSNQTKAFVPGGGPHGAGLKTIEGIGPHQKGWLGGPMNPWVYGTAAYPSRMFSFGLGMPATYLGAGINK